MQGYFTNSSVPFGYKKTRGNNPSIPDARILMVDPHAARAVIKCFEMYSTGKFTFEDLADMLNRREFHTAFGKPFSKQSISLLLKNQVYLGMIVYKKEIYLGRHEAIISQELWDQVQAVRRSKGNL